jgi:hypothetical protein
VIARKRELAARLWDGKAVRRHCGLSLAGERRRQGHDE